MVIVVHAHLIVIIQYFLSFDIKRNENFTRLKTNMYFKTNACFQNFHMTEQDSHRSSKEKNMTCYWRYFRNNNYNIMI